MEKRAVCLLGLVLGASCGGERGRGYDDDVTAATPGAIISDTDDRIEASGVTDTNISKFQYGTAAMWLGSLITDNGDGTSTISSTPYNTHLGQPICRGTLFRNQPVGSGLACTAFLVAPDMVATANHCLTEWGWTWDKWRILFDYSNPLFSFSVPNSKIFTPTAVLLADSATDTALLQLDRSVPEWRSAYPLDPAGKPTDVQFQRFINSIAAFGHGFGLPLKYSPNTGPYAGAWTFGDYYFLGYLDLVPGNSGSPVFDTSTSLVRGILTGQFVDDYAWDATRLCYFLQSYSPAQYPVQNSHTNSYVTPVANLLAPAGTLLEPTYRSAKTSAFAPSSVVLDSGDEYTFITASDYRIYSKHRDSQTAWSAWTEVPGFGQLASAPAAVAGLDDMWLFGRDSSGNLVYNRRWANGTWSNWGTITTPTRIAKGPAAFSFDTTGPGGVLVRVIVVSTVGTDGQGRMEYLTYRRQPGTSDWFWNPNVWSSGGYATLGSAASAAGGFGLPDSSGIATMVDANRALACARAVITSIPPPAPGQGASVSWSACPQAFPTNLPVLNAQGVALSNGTSYVVARGADDSTITTTRASSSAPWGAWTALGGRSFDTPSITKSLGTWWTYTQTADRRLAVR